MDELPKIHVSLTIDYDMWFYLLEKNYALNNLVYKIVFEHLSINQREQISKLFKIRKASYVIVQLRFDDEGIKFKTLYKEYYGEN